MASNLSGEQKAAVLLMSLGSDLSSKVLKHGFSDEEIELITSVITDMDHISSEETSAVIEEFYQLHQARSYVLSGGLDYAKDLLEKTVGPVKTQEILEKISQSLQKVPFQNLRKSDPRQLISFIRDENPQTIAFVLAHLKPDQAAAVLSELPPEVQADVSRRVAVLDRTSPDIAKEIEQVLERKLSTVVSTEETVVGGIKSLVNILNKVDRSTEKAIFEHLEATYPDLAEEVRRLMFIFEDIVKLHDVSIQKVLREVDTKDLALAMRGANSEVNERIFKNMSKRASEMLREEIDYMGPVRLRDVEQAQQKIVNVIRKLEESGEIVISRGGEDALIV
ncbi:flagellar motor switch protein FliG [Desulfohalotomaculum tongense]|uniref:flagellar motor switch protein FliG n=1 Tax=Desulforadius tongensis TaxID=1216062 RepID=UPI001957AFDF|nr:flagellar motor switch protein FliG [Desulforadius tongensis]MBM7854210.1 flagellar motor switch protein FliG [Desulforadius tongensis]